MGEAARYPTLAPVLFVTLHLHMLPESRAAYADVDDDIETAPFSNRLLTTVLKKRRVHLHFNGAPSQQIVLGNADQSL